MLFTTKQEIEQRLPADVCRSKTAEGPFLAEVFQSRMATESEGFPQHASSPKRLYSLKKFN